MTLREDLEPSSMAVDSYGNVYVLDKTANNLQVLQPTGFTLKVTAAVEMYQQGLYEESFDLGKKFLTLQETIMLHIKVSPKPITKKACGSKPWMLMKSRMPQDTPRHLTSIVMKSSATISYWYFMRYCNYRSCCMDLESLELVQRRRCGLLLNQGSV